MIITSKIKSYYLLLGKDWLTRTSKGEVVHYCGRIFCDGEKVNLVIYFLSDDSTLPSNEFYAGQMGITYAPISQYPYFLDMLRAEKPVNIYIDGDNFERHALYTGAEPVGESE